MSEQRLAKGPWVAVWHGGRLADVFWSEYPDLAVACIDTSSGFEEAFDEWLAEDAEAFLVNEVPYLPRRQAINDSKL